MAATYAVLSPLDHDGQYYEPGDAVDIADAEQAKALVSSGVIELVAKGKTKGPQ